MAPRHPWELIRQLNRAGARAIVFDVVFDQPSDPAEDERFAGAIRSSRVPVVLAAATQNLEDPHFHLFQKIMPLASLMDAGARPGLASFTPDVDGVLRHAPRRVSGLPSLAVAAFQTSETPPNRAVEPARDGSPEFLIDYAGPARTIPTVSYYQALDAEHSLPRNCFRGKTVWIGRSLGAQELANGAARQDLFATPFDTLMPGVEVHANAFLALERGEPLRRARLAWTWLFVLAGGTLVAAVLASPARLPIRLLVSGGIIVLAPAVAAVAMVSSGRWLYSVQPALVTGGVFLVNALYQYRAADQERLLVRKALSGYVSKPVLRRILHNPAALQLGGVQVEATVLFSDIVGFSSIAERITPTQLASELNAYFTRIGDIIMAHDGMIDKYIGDAIMAVWGAPLSDSRQAVRACAASLSMRRAVGEPGGLLRARIGINTGPMLAGNLGHKERMEYTVIGDAVNLSSRLEGANKLYGTSILVSQSTMAAAGEEFVFRPVDRIQVLGKQEPVAVYELLSSRTGDIGGQEQARACSFAGIVEAYNQRQWHDALEAIARHRLTFPGEDKLLHLYEERCRQFVCDPPPTNWDGVYSLTSK